MSRFFVGQRVRLVRPGFPENMGKTGRIRSLTDEYPGRNYMLNCWVDWDQPLAPKFRGHTHTSRLEPILDPPISACDDEFKRDLDKLLEGLPA